MAGQVGFDHIKVTPSEDEEVIVAGRPSVSREEAHYDHASGSHGATPAEQTNGDQSGVAEQPVPPSSAQAGRGGIESRDQYHETTMEDIKSSKMSTMQKVIIAIAIILVIAFVIYSITA